MLAGDHVVTQTVQGTQGMLAREHVSSQATLTRQYISTQGTLTYEERNHSRHVSTRAHKARWHVSK